MVPVTVPLATLAAKPERAGAPNRSTTQIGTSAATSGSGAPSIGALTAAVSLSRSVHPGFVVASQPARHTRTVAFGTMPSPCASPVQPRSMSLPLPAVVRRSSEGPPAGLGPQAPAPALGTQRSCNVSEVFLGLPDTVVVSFNVTRFDGFWTVFFVRRRGRVTTASLPHVIAVTGVGGGAGTGTGTSLASRFGMAFTVARWIGLEEQPATPSRCRQAPTATLQVPFATRSRSHPGSPSWQSMPVFPWFGAGASHPPWHLPLTEPPPVITVLAGS